MEIIPTLWPTSQVVPKHKEFAPFDVKNLVKNMTANKLLFVGVLIQ